MVSRTRTMRHGGLLLVGLAGLALTACAGTGDLSVVNEGSEDVAVDVGDQVLDVSSDGAVELLDSGCTAGDVTVEFGSGAEQTLPGPICPEQQIMIDDGDAGLEPAPAENHQ